MNLVAATALPGFGGVPNSGEYIDGATHGICGGTTQSLTASNCAASLHRATPFFLPERTSLNLLGCKTGASPAANSLTVLCIYENDLGPARPYRNPGALVANTTELDSSQTSTELTGAIAVTLDPGWWWFSQVNGGTGSPNFNALLIANGNAGRTIAKLTLADLTGNCCRTKALTFTAPGLTIPDPFGTPTGVAGFMPYVRARVA